MIILSSEFEKAMEAEIDKQALEKIDSGEIYKKIQEIVKEEVQESSLYLMLTDEGNLSLYCDSDYFPDLNVNLTRIVEDMLPSGQLLYSLRGITKFAEEIENIALLIRNHIKEHTDES